MRSIEPQPNNSTGGSSFAACPEELCAWCHVQGHQGCESHGPCQDPPVSHLATSAGYGHGRQGAGLGGFGGLMTSPRPTPEVISDSEDQQPHFPGGC